MKTYNRETFLEEAKRLRKMGWTNQRIADELGCTPGHVSMTINHGFNWNKQRQITKLFKKYIVQRPNGNCQVLFALTELDDLVDEIIEQLNQNMKPKITLIEVLNMIRLLKMIYPELEVNFEVRLKEKITKKQRKVQ